MRLVLIEFSSLDGVTQGPGSPEEDPSDGFVRGGWFVPYLEEEFIETCRAWAGQADAYLFGRRTYTAFARDWPNMPDLDDPVARAFNTLPKHVVSDTLDAGDAGWDPTTIITGDVESQIVALKAKPGRECQIHGSTRLARWLFSAGLIDELRLVVAPVVVGHGRRLFDADDHATGLQLDAVRQTPGGLTILTLHVDGPATVGTYDPAVHMFDHAGRSD